MYRLRQHGDDETNKVRLIGSGTILREIEAAAEMLHEDYGVTTEVWSVTSFNELAREGQDVARWNLLHPEEEPRVSFISESLQGDAPVVAASDYMKTLAEQLRPYIPANYKVLGTDGFGRSDTREALRHFFEVDRKFITLAALRCLADEQKMSLDTVRDARDALGIDPEKVNPRMA